MATRDEFIASAIAEKESAPASGAAEEKQRPVKIIAQPMRADLTEARRLFGLGFKMCKLLPHSKQPEGDGWNTRPITSFDDGATGYGVMLAANGLCSVDPDNAELSTKLLAGFGFDLEALLNGGVRSTSTRQGSGGRSAFRAPPSLRRIVFSFKEYGTVLELRAHSPNLQDVVPGLLYADKEGQRCTQRYASDLRLDDAPDLPADFLDWWQRMSIDLNFKREQQRKAGEFLGISPNLSVSSADGKSLAFKSEMRQEFNDAHPVPDILLRHRYDGDGERFAPPTATGKPGVRPIPGKEDLWQSDHASDPLFGTFDAWTAFVVLDHDSDQEAAEAAWTPCRNQKMLAEFDHEVDINDLLGITPVAPPPLPLPSFKRDKEGRIVASKENVVNAIGRPDICGHQLRHDEFRAEIMLAPAGTEEWRAFKDTDYTALCMLLERDRNGMKGFKNITKERIRETVAYVADKHRFDSAKHWLNSLEWDGTPRVATFLPRYFGTEDTAYTRAVSLYLWTALAGRILEPGIKADMVPVAVGPQGARKSSTVAAIVPSPDFFLDLDIGGQDKDLARLLRGKLVIELGELKGLRKREIEHVKNFITRQHEEWTPKFFEMNTRYARRSVFFGTTNKDEFLEDETGHRRWLPFHAGVCDPHGVADNREQLWAEAMSLFNTNGIMWSEAENLAKAEHEAYVVHDAWEEIVETWLTTPESLSEEQPLDKPFRAVDALLHAIRMQPHAITQAAKDRMAKVLKVLGPKLGFVADRPYIDGKRVRGYVRKP
ncbi:MAG TPA: VapE domain-containing protein [Noviherbaspirillum sp.]|nr:VapE domain-containing protein [Noviherbaspirillum sp.]